MQVALTEIMDIFKEVAIDAMEECQKDYEAICEGRKCEPLGKIQVLEYK